MSQAAPARQHAHNGYSLATAWPSLAVTVLVALSAIYSFSPRSLPPFPPTQIKPAQLLVNGLAASGNTLLAAGEQGRILWSEDAGAGWQEAQVQPQRGSTFTQIAYTGERTALAVGHDSWIVRSEDGGKSWKEVHFNPELATPLMGVSGPYDGRLYAYGGFGLMLVSENGGKSWKEVHFNPELATPLMGVSGPHDGRLYAYGGFGLMLVSENGGKSWQTKSDPAIGDHHVNTMTRAADGSLFAAGERGLLVRSADNGVTWQRLPEIYNGSFYGILSLPSQELVVYGMRGNVFHSRDLGKTWVRSTVPEGGLSLFGGSVDDKGVVTLVGEAEVVLRSTDGGASFTELAQGERKRLVAVLPRADGFIVAGESGLSVRKPPAASAAAQEPQS